MSTPPISTTNAIDKTYFDDGFKARVICYDPYIVLLKNFISDDEIEAIHHCNRGFKKSVIVVNDEMVESNQRTSETSYLTQNGQFDVKDCRIKNLLNKVCYLANCKRSQIEGLMMVKYEVGQYYYDHHDYFEAEFRNIMKDGGQRIATFFVYLNTVEGGETEFPKAHIKVKPHKGDALFWWNVHENGKPIKRTLHRGNKVTKGTKYGLNIWIRADGW